MSAVRGSRIYPPVPNLWLNLTQDLYNQLTDYMTTAAAWATIAFFNEVPNTTSKLEQNILNSVQWHNRSASLAVEEDVALLHLAIALESLLNLDAGEKVTERFKETLQTLLGPLPRLEWWADQFYQARSKIVHQGSWPHLNFYAVDKDQRTKIYKGTKEGVPFNSLTAYGRRIFRLCLNTILAGALQARSTNLASSLIPNAERLVKLKDLLEDTDTPLEKHLSTLTLHVLDLSEFDRMDDEEIDLGLLMAVSRSFCKEFLKIVTDVPAAVEQAMKPIISEDKNISTVMKMEKLRILATSLQEWKGFGPVYYPFSNDVYQVENMKKDLSHILWAFTEYASGPFFYLQSRREDNFL